MHRIFPLLLLAFALGATATPLRAQDTLHCRVSSVHDGDSMRVKCPGERRTQRVRLHQIDAPELEQPYGVVARDFLRKLCPKNSTVKIRMEGEDQYGRLLGDVYCQDKSVNEEMLRSGSAWVYERHAEDRELKRYEREARSEKRGLWAYKNPEAPWRWRYKQRQSN